MNLTFYVFYSLSHCFIEAGSPWLTLVSSPWLFMVKLLLPGHQCIAAAVGRLDAAERRSYLRLRAAAWEDELPNISGYPLVM